jgi:hypothetical protein
VGVAVRRVIGHAPDCAERELDGARMRCGVDSGRRRFGNRWVGRVVGDQFECSVVISADLSLKHRSLKFHVSLYLQGHISGILAGFLISLGLFMWFSNVIFYIALFWYAHEHTADTKFNYGWID